MLDHGDAVPNFSLAADDGTTFDLASARGKPVVAYFYPRDDTPGCTVEAKDFTAAAKQFAAAGALVVGISKDSIASHCKFRDKYKLGIRLLSDADLTVHKAFGAWGEKVMYGQRKEGVIRSTFLIGADGKLVRAWRSVKVAGHVDQVLNAVLEQKDSPPATRKSATLPSAQDVAPAQLEAPKKVAAKKVSAPAKKPVGKTPVAKKPVAKKPVAKK